MQRPADSVNSTTGHDTITGSRPAVRSTTSSDFSALNGGLNLEGTVAAGGTVTRTPSPMYSGGGAMVYVNDTTSGLSTTNATLMEIAFDRGLVRLDQSELRCTSAPAGRRRPNFGPRSMTRARAKQ